MGFLKSLFSSDEILKDAAKGAMNAADMLVFTDEEKSIRDGKRLDWMLEYQKASMPQNRARRMLSAGVMAIWMYLIVFMSILGVFSWKEEAEFLLSILERIVLQPFNIIMGFYFLTHVVGKFGGK